MAQFYKLTPNNKTLGEKAKFVFIEDESEESLDFIHWSVEGNFYEGCYLTPADKNDEDFKEYVKFDLEQVKKDICKLELLKANLENALT